MTRTVRALVSFQDRLLGAVPPFELESPWWPDTLPVVAHLDRLLGVSTTVLRLVSVEGGTPPAFGEVTYHVEAAAQPSFHFELHAADGLLEPHPLRAHFARPGGVAEIVAWAETALAAIGVRLDAASQVRTWNLSCLQRLETDAGVVWCKSTSPFQTPEHVPNALVRARDAALVPKVLAHRPGDVLLADVEGIDCWDADAATVEEVVRRWVGVQHALADGPFPDLPLRLPEELPARLGPALAALPSAQRDAVRSVLADLPQRLAALESTGLPNTLVHGDFHRGNWRVGPAGLTLVDWSDAFVGHPANDIVRLRDWAPALEGELRDVALGAWCDAWREARPGCDPEAAIEAVRPLVYLEAVCIYQGFLDGIEPSERIYHATDPAEMIELALAAVRG